LHQADFYIPNLQNKPYFCNAEAHLTEVGTQLKKNGVTIFPEIRKRNKNFYFSGKRNK